MRLKLEIKNILLIIVSSLVSAVGLWAFVAPGRFAPSGIDGIAAMFQELSKEMVGGTGIRAGYFSVLLNVPLLIMAWFILKRRYVIYTLIYMAFLSLFTMVLDWVNFPIYPVASELERFLAAIIGGIAQGLTGLMLRVGGSAGGVDVIACMIQKKRQSDNVEKIIALLSYVIALFSFFVWQGDVNAVIYSFVAIYAGEKMTAMVLKDSRSAVKFEIIVAKENAEKIKNVIVYEMKRSATIIEAKGIFLNEEKELIICLVHYRQFSDFLITMSQYPYLFLSYSEVLGIRGNFDWVLEYERPEDVQMRKERLKNQTREV
ncbi:MAG: YitT family protein [Clostridiales bacterium]|nr:YitT family protein [Clostridiales bacterium]